MKPYCHLDLSQRYQIYSLIQLKHKPSQIARQLGRDPTTIRREIKRGGGQVKYDPEASHKAYKALRKSSRKPYKFKGILKDRALCLLTRTDTEPAAIGPRLVLEYGSDMQVSAMTLYRYIYRDAACGGELYRHLRTARARPKKRKKDKTVRQIIKGRRFIEERPAVVDRVERLGDLERDTIVGPANKGAIQSIVDRKSSFCWLIQVHSKSAKATHIATRTLLKPVRDRVKSLTNDNGVEFAAHEATAAYLKTDVWFCRPYQTNQSARIEQINKLVRQYIPKKKDIRFVQPKYLKAICNKINSRPRKKLGYLTPEEVFLRDSKLSKLTDDP